MRLNGTTTVDVSEPEAGVTEAGSKELGQRPVVYPADYVGASEDGSKVFFLTKTELTKDAAELGLHDIELYEYDTETRKLTRVSAGEPGYQAALGTGTLSAATGVGALSAGSTKVADVVADTGAFAVGQQVSGPDIPAGTTIAAVGSGTLTLSAAATASDGAKGTGSVQANSTEVKEVLTSAGSFVVGQGISGAGIPAGTTITEVGLEKLRLSNPASATASAEALAAGAVLQAGSTEVTDVLASAGGFAVGLEIEGAGIPAGTTVSAVGEGTLTLSAPATLAASAVALHSNDPHVFTVPAVSADGSAVYFTAFAPLAPGASPDKEEPNGQSPVNLYRYDTTTQTTTYVAQVDTLDYPTAPDDAECGSAFGIGVALCSAANWYSTPNGRFLLFQSSLPVAGYNTSLGCPVTLPKSQGSGADGHCDELYRYDSEAAERGEQALLCVSCSPSGAPPEGSAQFARSNPKGPASGPVRAMSNDGAYVFFDTPSRLVPTAENHTLDVYEWHEGPDLPDQLAERPVPVLLPRLQPVLSPGRGKSRSRQRLHRHPRPPAERADQHRRQHLRRPRLRTAVAVHPAGERRNGAVPGRRMPETAPRTHRPDPLLADLLRRRQPHERTTAPAEERNSRSNSGQETRRGLEALPKKNEQAQACRMRNPGQEEIRPSEGGQEVRESQRQAEGGPMTTLRAVLSNALRASSRAWAVLARPIAIARSAFRRSTAFAPRLASGRSAFCRSGRPRVIRAIRATTRDGLTSAALETTVEGQERGGSSRSPVPFRVRTQDLTRALQMKGRGQTTFGPPDRV